MNPEPIQSPLKIKMSHQEVFLYRLALCAGILVTLLGASVIMGWTFDIPALKGDVQGINIKTNAGIALFLSGIALLRKCTKKDSDFLSGSLGAVVFLIGAATLTEHVVGWNLGIDELLFTEPEGVRATASPNRMGPPASVNFALVGLSLMLMSFRAKRSDLVTQLALLVGIIALIPILGYLFGAKELYGIAKYTGIALPTALIFSVLSAGLIAACPDGPVQRLLTATDAGGILVRRLLPAAIFVPILLGYLRTKGEQFNLYDPTFGRSMLVTAIILVFVRLIWSSARVLQETDKKRLELLESERAARNNAERANRFKDEFLATVSHELRTPLNAILGWSQLLKRKVALPAELGAGLDTIERNAKLQAQLIEDLLDMSRILSGKIRIDPKNVHLAPIISASIDSIKLQAATKKIVVRAELDMDATVSGDPDRLQQVLWNILSNAVKFTPTEGEITVSMEKADGAVRVIVSDTGQGIDQEFLDRMFDRFAQGDGSSTRRHGGLGIGLSVVRELVSMHGGIVSAASDGEGRGSSFVITLPMIESLAPEVRNTASETAMSPQSDGLSLAGIKVLVVDDDTDSRELAGRLLGEREAEVIYASSAREALERLKEHKPDVLVSDIGMPEVDGYQLIQKIRALSTKDCAKIPAIALTAFVREEDKGRAIRAGFSAHLEKPVDAFRLVSTVKELSTSPLEVKYG